MEILSPFLAWQVSRKSLRPIQLYVKLFLTSTLVVFLVVACRSDETSAEITPTETAVPVVVSTILAPTSTASTPYVTPTVSSTVIVTATANPPATPVETASPTPTAMPTVALPDLSLADVNLGICRLSGDLLVGGERRRGTAAAPTPTPKPPDSSRDTELVSQEAGAYRKEINGVLVGLGDYSEAMQFGWAHSSTTERQAAQLHVFGNRLAQMCAAASMVPVPPEVLGEAIRLGESLRISHAWTVLAVDELNCCGTAKTEFMDVGYTSTSIELVSATIALDLALAKYAGSSESYPARILESERFGLQMDIDETAVLLRNSVDLAVGFPNGQKFLDPASLGPGIWTIGSGFRIRRIRNGVELTVEEAIFEYEGLIGRFGEPSPTGNNVLSMLDAVQFAASALEHGWIASITVFVRDGFTYLIESMCHPDFEEQCERVTRSIDSIRAIE